MLRITLHQKQGELQTVPIQPSHHVSSLAFRISALFRPGEPGSRFGFRISPDLSGGIMRNEPNPNTPHDRICETNPIRAHCHPTHNPNTRNEPNLPHAHHPPTQKYETNPISTHPIMRNEPNPTRPTAKSKQPTAKKCETNPIYRLPTHAYSKMRKTNPIYHPTPDPRSKYAKRTQSQHGPRQNMRNERNLLSRHPPHTPKCAKRTQFAPRPPSAGPKIRNEPNLPPAHDQNAKQTQLQPRPEISRTGTVPARRDAPKMRNEPNLRPAGRNVEHPPRRTKD